MMANGKMIRRMVLAFTNGFLEVNIAVRTHNCTKPIHEPTVNFNAGMWKEDQKHGPGRYTYGSQSGEVCSPPLKRTALIFKMLVSEL